MRAGQAKACGHGKSAARFFLGCCSGIGPYSLDHLAEQTCLTLYPFEPGPPAYRSLPLYPRIHIALPYERNSEEYAQKSSVSLTQNKDKTFPVRKFTLRFQMPFVNDAWWRLPPSSNEPGIYVR